MQPGAVSSAKYANITMQNAIAAVRSQIAALDSGQPITDVQTANELIDSSRTQPRFMMLLIGAFSATALALAVVGIYSVLSYTVAQRRQEFGIRLALGADPADILRMVMHQAILLAGSGIVTGLCAALVLTRLLEDTLYDTGPHDLTIFVAAPVLFLCVTALAGYVPARRAMSVDPVETLR